MVSVITFDCPACGFNFVNRTDGRCPKCRALLTFQGERFDPVGDEPIYAWVGGQWMAME